MRSGEESALAGGERLAAEIDLGASVSWRPNRLEDRNEKKERSIVSHMGTGRPGPCRAGHSPLPGAFLALSDPIIRGRTVKFHRGQVKSG